MLDRHELPTAQHYLTVNSTWKYPSIQQQQTSLRRHPARAHWLAGRRAPESHSIADEWHDWDYSAVPAYDMIFLSELNQRPLPARNPAQPGGDESIDGCPESSRKMAPYEKPPFAAGFGPTSQA